jgi:hypothetical protein
MFDRIIYEFLYWINGVSTKITSWSWCKLYSDRRKGYGYRKKKIDPGMVSQGHLMIITDNVGTIYLVKIKINLIDYNKSKGTLMQVTNNLN